MKGYGSRELATVDIELKEAVCDSLVNILVGRVSGTDAAGKTLYGRSPLRSVVSGHLLPRFDSKGMDETSDIRIAAMGIDFVVQASAADTITAIPTFSVYVRVLPSWSEVNPNSGVLEVDFRLKEDVQEKIDKNIRERRKQAFKEHGLEKPDWKKMDEPTRQRVQERRAALQEEVRVAAYAEQGILLKRGDLQGEGRAAEGVVEDDLEANQNAPEQQMAVPTPVMRLIREGREIPFGLIEPAQIPGKWRRLDLVLPALEWPANLAGTALAQHVAKYEDSLVEAVNRQLDEWVSGEGVRDCWRDVTVRPQDITDEASWESFLQRVRSAPVDRSKVLPDVSQVKLKVERTTDFLDPTSASIRVLLDNQSSELGPREASFRCNAVFGAGLEIRLAKHILRPLRLDRVEPSYRFRDYLDYPALGLNCGIVSEEADEQVILRTTWAPRFAQPRIVPSRIDVPCNFLRLADPDFDVSDLLELPRRYRQWVSEQESKLAPVVATGLSPEDGALEKERLAEDLRNQLKEAEYIERGIRLLIRSQAAAKELAANGRPEHNLVRLAAPWRAWMMMNESFSRREGHKADRAWRLFQLAFILAHIPTFASRMDEYRDSHDPLLDEEGASLLYFPTGGGKSEAFYGTLLFALFLDRLRGKDRGITGLIRYPLRLLTLQQAQRFLKLLVHAELVRMAHGVGEWPFEIGFWVGSANTPNNYSGIRPDVPLFMEEAFPDDTMLEEGAPVDDATRDRGRRYREIREAYNKVPECPICRSATGLRRYETEGRTARRAVIVCFNPNCDWNEKHGGIHPLPFLLTDDAIYARAPSIVLGTVDKLAMLGQHTETIGKVLGMFGMARWVDPSGHLYSPRDQSLLSQGPEENGYSPVFPAYRNGERIFVDPFPSVIIQDEAHLLEESLGTFSGLFDTLLENVLGEIAQCAGDDLRVARRWTGGRYGEARMPKIVAATATISNPERQLETLYQRVPLRFPYPGPDIYRSFFAEPAQPPEVNAERIRMSMELPRHLAVEAAAPWMRLYVSLMTNGATHTVTTVGVLSAFHAIITSLWRGLLEPRTRDNTIAALRSSVSPGRQGDWRRAAIDRAVGEGRISDLIALIDLHRIALAYVTNKKGGDQVIDALDAAVHQRHRQLGLEIERFDSRLISGGIDMKDIQRVMSDAETSFEGQEYPEIDTTVRNIVATSAISHGVDVDRFNSMFFAGLPSDIAEYIQASSRVGRTHVGFVMLLPTPQNRRDRYVVETHDIFHRFLERMIAPPAVERWAENAIKRVLASFVQAWVMLNETKQFIRLPDDRKQDLAPSDQVRRLRSLAVRDIVGFCNEVGDFILRSTGFAGRGQDHIGRPHYEEYYRGLVDRQVHAFAQDMARQNTAAWLRDYWDDLTPVFKKPMTSLRDVDEAGYIVASTYDPGSSERTTRVNREYIALVMREIRSQRGNSAETDADGRADG